MPTRLVIVWTEKIINLQGIECTLYTQAYVTYQYIGNHTSWTYKQNKLQWALIMDIMAALV